CARGGNSMFDFW
nr:immunoglobulin heavy chain junction region [Macaca mulatta]